MTLNLFLTLWGICGHRQAGVFCQTGSGQPQCWASDGSASEKSGDLKQDDHLLLRKVLCQAVSSASRLPSAPAGWRRINYITELQLRCCDVAHWEEGQIWPLVTSTCLSLDIKEISGGLGTIYVVSWATMWTCRVSCHGETPAWWTNISAYRVPLWRVFVGMETFTTLWKTVRGKKTLSMI